LLKERLIMGLKVSVLYYCQGGKHDYILRVGEFPIPWNWFTIHSHVYLFVFKSFVVLEAVVTQILPVASFDHYTVAI